MCNGVVNRNKRSVESGVDVAQSTSRTPIIGEIVEYMGSTTFTPLLNRLDSLPLYYRISCIPYSIVGILLLAYSDFKFEGVAYILVAFTSHFSDVSHFGKPGMNVVVDSIWAPITLITSVINCGLFMSFFLVPIPLYFFLRGQLKDPKDESKLDDHARWHFLGQILRIAVLWFCQRR